MSVIGCEYQNGRANHIQQLRPKTDQIFEAMPVRSTNMRHTHTRSSAMMLSRKKKKPRHEKTHQKQKHIRTLRCLLTRLNWRDAELSIGCWAHMGLRRALVCDRLFAAIPYRRCKIWLSSRGHMRFDAYIFGICVFQKYRERKKKRRKNDCQSISQYPVWDMFLNIYTYNRKHTDKHVLICRPIYTHHTCV